MTFNKTRVGGLILAIFSATYTALSYGIPILQVQTDQAITAQTMPLVLGYLGLVLCALLVMKGEETTDSSTAPAAGVHSTLRHLKWLSFFLLLALMSLYGLSLRSAGFLPATFAFLFCCFLVLGERRLVLCGVVACTISLSFWALLNWGLGVYIAPWPSSDLASSF